MADDARIAEIMRKIQRERQLLDGYSRMRQAAENTNVQSQVDAQIREGQRNIQYFEATLRDLQTRSSGSGSSAISGGIQNMSIRGAQNSSAFPAGSNYGPYAGQQGGATGQASYGTPGPGGYSDIHNQHGMPARGPFAPVPPGSAIPRTRANYTKLDLIKYDTPHLGPRIQLMLSQLEFKLSVEKQYKDGIDKIIGSYRMDGDKKIRNEASGRRTESMQKIQLLQRALKRYEDLHVDTEQADGADDDSLSATNMRKPLTGQLMMKVQAVHDVAHPGGGKSFRKIETYVSVKVEDEFKVKTKPARNDKWTDETHEFAIDKGNEVELTVYDKSGSDAPLPIGMLWIRISDIAEEMRRKKIETELASSGWVSADRTVEDSNAPRPDLQFSPPPNASGAGANSHLLSGHAGNNGEQPHTGPVVIESWFALEPVGRIQLSLSFSKQTRERKLFDAGLGRKGAIRQRKEDVREHYGHKFVAQQFYNIMRCALCGELLKYAVGMQCSDCKYLCHEKCYSEVVTKCISRSNAESDPGEAKLSHKIPHRWEVYGNIGANWCCHCGYMLPLGKKSSRKCRECKLTCHAHCTHLVPDFCGMSMKDANKILKVIKDSGSMSNKTLRPPGREPKPSGRPTVSATPSWQPESAEMKSAASKHFSYGELSESDRAQAQAQAQAQSTPSPESIGAAKYMSAQAMAQQGRQERRPVATRSDSSQQALAAAAAAASALQPKRPTGPTPAADARNPYARTPSYPVDKPVQAMPSTYTYNPSDYAQVDQGYSQLTQPSMQSPPVLPQIPSVVTPPAVSAQVDNTKRIVNPTQPGPPTSDSITKFKETREPPNLERQRGSGRRIGLDHFNFLAVLGKGNFGKVMLAETKATKALYAIKVLKKEFIIENDEVESTKSERDVFIIANRARHPFLLNLHACFQTETRVYFVMEYISGGDLMLHIQRGNFGTKRAQFYAAEVCLALKYFHENGVVYRDLKLDNILLTLDGHIKIADYGLCKKDMYYGSTTSTFCGTPEFMAPEILLDKRYGRAVDWWAFGVLIYQMLLQQSPFRGEDEDEIYDAILADEPLYPIHMPRDSVSILQKLLTREPELRLGSGPTDAQEIMSHSFFKSINWEDVYHKRVPSPFLPQIKSATDTSNFDSEFTSVTPVLTPVHSQLTQQMQEEFRGFSYSADFV